jgi:hypothetical protein
MAPVIGFVLKLVQGRPTPVKQKMIYIRLLGDVGR